MNLIIHTPIGELNATISTDFRKLDIENYGRVDLQASEMSINSCFFHSFYVTTYNSCYSVFKNKIEEKGITLTDDYREPIYVHGVSLILKLDSKSKSEIEKLYLAETAKIEEAFLRGEIEMEIKELGHGIYAYPSFVFKHELSIKVGYWLLKKYGLHEFIKQLPFFEQCKNGVNVAEIVAEYARNLETEEKRIEKCKEEARRTNQRVLVHKNVVPDSQTPIAGDDEDDLVDELIFVKPDGSFETEYVHNY